MKLPAFVTRPATLALVTGALALAAGACSPPDEAVYGGPAFPGSERSLQALGRTALEALSDADSTALERLRLTEPEHNQEVWPELPASNPEVNFPLDYAWDNIQRRNRRALSRIQPWFQDREMTLARAECRGETREFDTFRVHTDCWVLFETPVYGLLEVQLYKDVLERNGGFKIFRFYDDGPRQVAVSPGT